jgi:hypothetical protein
LAGTEIRRQYALVLKAPPPVGGGIILLRFGDDWILIMPSRNLLPGQTAVRLGRLSDDAA